MADISESLFQMVDIIVNKRLQAINFDNTDIYSITDASRAEFGEYKVTDGNITFTAYSTNTDYKENEAVYVTIPNNDFNQQKLIIGKYTANSDIPFVFTNPTSTMIDVTGNIINGEIQEAGLTANTPNDGNDEEHEPYPYSTYTEENEEEIIIWQLDCQDRNYIGFERLGIKGDFKAWLNELNCVRGHYGLKLQVQCIGNDTYSNKTIYELINKRIDTDWNWVLNTSNVVSEMEESIEGLDTATQKQKVREYVQRKLDSLYQYYYFLLDTDDMIGDVYNFVSYHRQEQVYDISNIGQITKMELSFYQKPHTFLDMADEEISYTDMFGHILNKNLFTIDPYITLGYDLNNFDGEQALLVTTDSLSYKQADSIDSVTKEGDIYHKKVIHLSWIHEEKNGKIVSIETENEVDGIYEIRWYQKSAGAASPDQWAGVEWKRLTQNGDGSELGDRAFEYTLIIDQDSYNKPYEQIKAIIVYTPTSGTTIAIRSNILNFVNENDVINKATIDMSRGLTFNFLDGTNGIYYIYRKDYNLIDENQGNVIRKVQCELYSEEFDLAGPLIEAKSISWHIPANNSMIYIEDFDYRGIGLQYTEAEVIAAHEGAATVDDLTEEEKTKIGKSKEPEYYDSISYEKHKNDIISEVTDYLNTDGTKASYGCKTTGLLYDIDNKEIVITWYGNEDNAYSINSVLEYRIKNTYAQNNTNNVITCVVNKNNRDYVGKLDLRFGVGGTNGTSYTLLIEAYDQGNGKEKLDTALIATTPNSRKEFRAILLTRTPEAEEINFHNNENFENLQFEWKLGDSKEVTSYINSGSSYSIMPSNTSAVAADTTDYNLKIGEMYYKDTDPYRVTLTYNANINDLLYLCLTLKGWGDYNLKTVLPIPIRSKTIDFSEGVEGYIYQVSHINGPRDICYHIDGYPEFMDNPYTLYVAEFEETTHILSDNDIQVNSAYWTIYNPFDKLRNYDKVEIAERCNNAIDNNGEFTANGTWLMSNVYPNVFDSATQQSHNNEDPIVTRRNQIAAIKSLLRAEYYIGSITENNVLKPLDFYIPNTTGYGVQAYYGNNTVAWTQPIWVYQNDYGSSALDEWNGKDLKIDEESGTIISRGIAAGKKESDNTFTGAVIGDWSATDDNEEVLTRNTGVYGFNHGAMTYAFKDDGTAFIGASGKGRILFNGDQSTITSENYNSLGVGLSIDLDDGIIQFRNIKNTGGTNNTSNANNYFITLNASNNNLRSTDSALSIGQDNPNFYVQWDGKLYATNADIQGYIHGSTINIANGNFTVDPKGRTYIWNARMNTAEIGMATIENGTLAGSVHFTANSYFDNGVKLSGGIYENPTLNIYYDTAYSGSTYYEWVRTYSYVEGVSQYWLSGVSIVTLNRTEFQSAIDDGYAIYYYKAVSSSYTETSANSNANRIHFWSGNPSTPGSEIAHIGYYRGGTTNGTVTSNLGLSTFGSGHSIILDSNANISLGTGGGTSNDNTLYISRGKVDIGTHTSEGDKVYARFDPTNKTLWVLKPDKTPGSAVGDTNYCDVRYAYFA